TVAGPCGRDSVVGCQLAKLDVAGSTPGARSREFEELAPRRYEPPACGGSLVALGPRGFSAEPAYLGEGSCHPLEQVCEGIRRAGSCTWGYIPQKQLDSWTARAFLWPEATWDLSAPSPSVTEGSPEEDAVAIPCMIRARRDQSRRARLRNLPGLELAGPLGRYRHFV